MTDYLARKTGEAHTSRHIQTLVPKEEGSQAREARSSIDDTIEAVAKTNLNSAGGSVTEHGLTGSQGKYGKVRVIAETHSGHILLLDESDGNSRLFWMHPSGTYMNVENDGSQTNKVIKDKFTLVTKNYSIEVGENRVEFVHGNETITIDKDKTITIKGNETTNVQKSKTDTIKTGWTVNVTGGDANITTSGDTNIACATSNVSCGAANIAASGAIVISGATVAIN